MPADIENLSSAAARLDLGKPGGSSSAQPTQVRLAMGALQVQPLQAPGAASSSRPPVAGAHLARKPSLDALSANSRAPSRAGSALPSENGSAPASARPSTNQARAPPHKTASGAAPPRAPPTASSVALRAVDIGKYDGGMERDERRGRRTGDFGGKDAALLALDSGTR
jgi:aurora kinase